MFTNSLFIRCGRIARLTVLAAALAVASVPATMTLGIDNTAQAQSSSGGGGGGGGGGGSKSSGRSGPNPVLECLGPDCINVNQAQLPPCPPGVATYACQPKVEKRVFKDSCEVQVCDVIYGERVCWLERAYDVRICKKERL